MPGDAAVRPGWPTPTGGPYPRNSLQRWFPAPDWAVQHAECCDPLGAGTMFGALTVAEASQAETVKQTHAHLLRLMEQHMTKADAAERKKLEQYKELLGAIERAPVLNESSLGATFG